MMRTITMKLVFAALMVLVGSSFVHAQNAPYLPPIDDQTAMIGEEFSYDVNALYADPAETYELLESMPGMNINPSTGVITWTPATVNDGGKVTVRAFNTAGESVRSFLVYLSDAIICDNDIISYWKFDETSGTILEDYQGPYDATALTATSPTSGQVDGAQQLAPEGRTDQFIVVDDQGQYDFARSGGFAISMWFRYDGQHTTSTINQVLVARGDPSTVSAELFMLLMVDVQSTGSPRVSWSLRPNSTENFKTVSSDVTINVGQWYHVVATYEGAVGGLDPSTLRLFVNNQSNYAPHIFGNYQFTGLGNYDLNIGFWETYPANRYPFNGALDEIVIYNRALSGTEVNDIYMDGLTGQPHCKPGSYYPLITSTPIEFATQDVEYSYTFEASDYQGGQIFLSAETLPSWLTFNPGSGLLSGTPGNDDVGDHDVRLKASDGSTEIFQDFTITVNNENDAPEITSTPSVTTINQGDSFTYTLVATDNDPGDVVTLSAPVLPEWMSFNPSNGVLSGTPGRNEVGTTDSVHQITLQATDLAGLFVQQEIDLTVVNINDAPEVISQNPLVITRGETAELSLDYLVVDDPDNTYPDEHTLTVVAGSNYTFEGNVVTPTNYFYGNLAVNIELSDGDLTTEYEFTVTVNYVNIAPEFTSTPPSSAFEAQAYTYVVVVEDPDEDDPDNPQTLTFTTEILPNWLTFDPATRVMVGIPQRSDAGDNLVRLKVSDGTLEATQEFTIDVVSTNNKPVITSVPPSFVDNYSEYLYKLTAFDADPADVLSYGVEILPPWLSFDPVTQILSGIPEKIHVGDNAVILTVSDGFDIVKQEFTINVRDVATPPQVTSQPSKVAYIEQLYTYLVSAVDYDGDPITYIGTVIPGWLTFDPASKVLSGTPAASNVGSHQVLITLSDGLYTVNHQFTIEVRPVGVEQVESLTSVYPNPVRDQLVFELNEPVDLIQVTSLSGKVVIQQEVLSGESMVNVDVSSLTSGMYMYRVIEGKQVQTGKIIKE